MRTRGIGLVATVGMLVGAGAMAAPFAGAAGAGGVPSLTARSGRVAHPSDDFSRLAPCGPGFPIGPLWVQDQEANDTGVAVVAQAFTDPGFDVYDSQSADDFTVPANTTWYVRGIRVTGVYFNGPGPSTTQRLHLYADAGPPGPLLGWSTVSGANGPNFTFLFDPCVDLDPGTYSISVLAELNFASGGEWGWETRTPQNGTGPAYWRNPLDGFGTGCTTWAVMSSCIGSLGEGEDFMFAIGGSTNAQVEPVAVRSDIAGASGPGGSRPGSNRGWHW